MENSEEDQTRVVCWFSCGVTSAVAAKLTLDDFPDADVHIVYCDTNSEHPDNARFLKDCEVWYDHEIETIKSEKYEDVWDVWESTGWLVGPGGVRCSPELKKIPRRKYQKHDDLQVFGFDSGEVERAKRFRDNNVEVNLLTPLIDRNYSKADCGDVVMRAGIELPEMYRLGFKHSNCPMCPRGGQGYWNKIRVVFPENFERMANLERTLDVAINKTYSAPGRKGERVRVFLDELDPDAGNYEAEPSLECGLLCGVEEQGELF
jgi:3'-phosphoadenosine 5'-phosphosulfate sulfotransferase (PAPS reductase)/FAD synthetase